MRVVMKPAGFVFILVSILVLAGIALQKMLLSKEKPASITAGVSPAAPAPNAPASSVAALPPGVLLMPDITSHEWQALVAPSPDVVAAISVVDASVPGHPSARRIVNTKVSTHPWDIQLARPLSVSLKKGKQIRLTFWGRSKNSCPITIMVEKNSDPYTKIVQKDEILTPNWKSYSEEWTQDTDTPENWAKMDFQLGHKVGEIELTGVIIRQVGE